MAAKKLVLKFGSDAEKDAALLEACRILISLRKYTKIWDERYGNTRVNKIFWEQRADEFIENLNIKEKKDEEQSENPQDRE